ALPPLAIMFAALFGTVQADQSDVSGTNLRWTNWARDATTVAIALVISLTVLAAALFARHGGAVALPGNRLASSDASLAGIFADGVARLTPPFAIFVTILALGA